MGEIMVRIFEAVTERAGLKGRIELATKSGMSQKMAAQMKDTEELVNKLKENANLILDRSNLNLISK
jgi:predicted sulfurtransferase